MSERVYPPAIADDQTPQIVPYTLPRSKDSGSAWARGLKPEAIANLVDLAGEIAAVVSPLKDRRVTEKQFYKKLHDAGLDQKAQDRLVQIVGFNSNQMISTYHLWWAYCWTYNYTRASVSKASDDENIHELTCERMGIDKKTAGAIMHRRDVSFVLGLFFERSAKEMRGPIMWRTTEEALKGSPKHQQLFYDRVISETQNNKDSGGPVNWENLSEAELKAYIEKTKRDVGEPVETPIEIVIKDAEFEEKKE